MALPATCMIDVDALKSALGGKLQSTATLDTDLERYCVLASDAVEDELDWTVITRGSLTEYHTIREPRSIIWTRQPRLSALTSVKQDTGRTFTGAALVNGTDYVAELWTGRIQRVSGAYPLDWEIGIRVVQVVYAQGYADRAAVPELFRRAALDAATLWWREKDKGLLGLSSKQDQSGSIERYDHPPLPKHVKAYLHRHKRKPGNMPTWEL